MLFNSLVTTDLSDPLRVATSDLSPRPAPTSFTNLHQKDFVIPLDNAFSHYAAAS